MVQMTDFLPMSVKFKCPEEIQLRKRANLALAIFYICIVCGLLLSIITE